VGGPSLVAAFRALARPEAPVPANPDRSPHTSRFFWPEVGVRVRNHPFGNCDVVGQKACNQFAITSATYRFVIALLASMVFDFTWSVYHSWRAGLLRPRSVVTVNKSCLNTNHCIRAMAFLAPSRLSSGHFRRGPSLLVP
jgi:hypothetical protein